MVQIANKDVQGSGAVDIAADTIDAIETHYTWKLHIRC
jgi:hypothetical protein